MKGNVQNHSRIQVVTRTRVLDQCPVGSSSPASPCHLSYLFVVPGCGQELEGQAGCLGCVAGVRDLKRKQQRAFWMGAGLRRQQG